MLILICVRIVCEQIKVNFTCKYENTSSFLKYWLMGNVSDLEAMTSMLTEVIKVPKIQSWLCSYNIINQ